MKHTDIENTLWETEERFLRMFEQSPFGMALSDRAFRFTAANPAFCAMLGYTETELLDLTFKDITHPDYLSRDVESITMLARGEIQSYKTEKRYLTKSGSVIEGAVAVTALRNAAGRHVQSLVTLENITERKKIEEALRESEENYRVLAENMNDVLFKQNLDHTITYVNSSAEQHFGYTRREALSLTLDKLLTPPSLARVMESFRAMSTLAANADVKVPLLELEYVRKDGSTFWGELHVGFLKDPSGKLTGMLGVVRDVTERKKTEALLIKAQKLESLGVLAGGIAHDFNNLLTGLFGHIDLARATTKDAKTAEILKATLTTMNRARALTLQLLTFAKGGSPVRKIMPLMPVVRECAQFALSGSNISCRFDAPGDLRPCTIDKNQICQVIDNIVINAQQAMPDGGTIEIAARNITFSDGEHPPLAKGDYVKVSFKDPGTGMPKDVLPRIFDPFYTTKIKGHGLGLATCYSIINHHGGCIDVESEPGRGSTFHIYLPAAGGPVAEEDAPIALHTGSGKIVVVDDEQAILDTTRKMLELMGYAVVCLNDGRAAIDFYMNETKAGRRCAAMIFDFTIPGGMGGEEAVAGIRKLDRDVPVFLMSGYTGSSVMNNPEEHGFTASISKPFTIAEISEMLNRHVKKKH